MLVRIAQSSDASAIAKLLYRSFYQTFRNDKNEASVRAYLETLDADAIQDMMAQSSCQFLVLEENLKLHGMIQLLRENPYPEGNLKHLKVERLYIDTDSQGQGIGTILMQESLKIASREGLDSVWLLVLRSNIRGVAFYESLGFKSFDTSAGKFEEDEEIDLWMKLDLT